MKNSHVKYLFLLLSILSLFLLFILSLIYPIPKIPLNQISEKNIDEKILVEGIVERAYESPQVSYLTLKNSNISVVLFYPQNKIKINSSLEIIGKLSNYKGKLQLNAESINCLKCK